MIPVNEPLIEEEEIQNVLECLKTGWVSSEGKFITDFEEKWASYCGRKYGVAVSNGTVALEAAVWSLELPPASEILMPTFTIISCALAAVRNNCTPVLVDSEPETWCIDVDKIEEKITSKTRAIMPVHIYGHSVDMDPIIKLAEKYNLKIIEDAAEAHGAEYKSKKCGSFGDVSTFSFYANKLITTGEGGMVVTNDETLAKRIRDFRNLCFKKERRFYHTELGNNYRLTNLQAAIGSAQVGRIDQIVEKKRCMGHLYNSLLKDCPYLQLPAEKPWAKNIYWMYGVVLDEKSNLDARLFAEKLIAEGVQTRPFFLGMHEQPVFSKMSLSFDGVFPVSERIAKQGLYLPSGLTITEEQITEVVNKVKKVLSI